MGLGTKLVSGDQGLDWGQTLLQSGAAELSKPRSIRRQQPLQQRPEPLKCPRCGSKNTKFCYYNNYNKSQPRHFCKSCKRHWTKGGTLRNVPVGGGRKNKRPKISTAATDAAEVPTTAAGPGQQDRPRFPLSGNTTTADQKDMSKILYQALIRSSSPFLHETTDGVSVGVPGKPFMRSNGTNTMDSAGLIESGPQNLDTEFDQFSSLGTFDVNAFLVPTSYQSVNAYDRYYGGALDPMEESSITTVNINPSSSCSVPWPSPEFSSALDLASYWNWNESDALTSADLNTAWDDGGDGALIKP